MVKKQYLDPMNGLANVHGSSLMHLAMFCTIFFIDRAQPGYDSSEMSETQLAQC